jgi:putative ABC transport system ATP-binding protein
MEEKLIQTLNMTRTFFTEEVETNAIRKVTLEIDRGEFVAVMGPSGCGKTTLLNLLGLIDKPTSGSYTYDGLKVHGLSENQMTRIRRGNMGFIFQNYNLVDELNVAENVELPLVFQGKKRKEYRKRTFEILEQIRMGHRAFHYPQQLSGGQQQRVAFARAVVAHPKLILADEPTGNLDSKNGLMLLDLLAGQNRTGSTIVMVTHSPKDASYAHRIIHLHDGEIRA